MSKTYSKAKRSGDPRVSSRANEYRKLSFWSTKRGQTIGLASFGTVGAGLSGIGLYLSQAPRSSDDWTFLIGASFISALIALIAATYVLERSRRKRGPVAWGTRVRTVGTWTIVLALTTSMLAFVGQNEPAPPRKASPETSTSTQP